MSDFKNISLKELAVILFLGLIFLGVNLLTAHWFPLPWVDEVMYSDPSINYVMGNGFTSTAWPSVPSDVYWAGNTPLHEWILIPWLKLFGISALSVRSINVVLVVFSVVALTWASRRLGFLRSPLAIIFVALLFFSSIGMNHIARDGRPDGVKAFFAAMGLLAYSISPPNRRYALFLAGIFFPAAGFQLVAFAIIVCLVAWIFLGKVFFWDGFSLGLGCLAGLVLLLGFFATQGVSRQFLENTLASGHTITGDLAQTALFRDEKVKKRLGDRFESFAKLPEIFRIDRIHPWLIVYSFICGIILLRTKKLPLRSAENCTFLVALIAPPITILTGKYFLHYTWIGAIPLILAAGMYFDRMAGIFRVFSFGLIIIAVCFGFPAELIERGSQGTSDFENIKKFVAKNIKSYDSVYAGSAVYYAVKARAKFHYSTEYAGGRGLPKIPDDERQSITAIFVPKNRLAAALEKVGGEWESTGLSIPLPSGEPEEPEYFLYRRKNNQ